MTSYMSPDVLSKLGWSMFWLGIMCTVLALIWTCWIFARVSGTVIMLGAMIVTVREIWGN